MCLTKAYKDVHVLYIFSTAHNFQDAGKSQLVHKI